MKSLFNMDSLVMRFFTRVFDIGYLNILCLICCIPIITIGPAITALYYCMLKISRDRDTSITKMFFHSFKMNLKQGVFLTIIFGGIASFLAIDVYICGIIGTEYAEYIKTFLYIIVALFVAIVSYAFPMLAQFDNTIKNILRNSFFMAISNLIYTIIIICLNAIPVVLFWFLPGGVVLTMLIWSSFGFAATAMINSKMFVKIFDKFITEE